MKVVFGELWNVKIIHHTISFTFAPKNNDLYRLMILTCAIPEPIRPPPITVTCLIIDGAVDRYRAIVLLIISD